METKKILKQKNCEYVTYKNKTYNELIKFYDNLSDAQFKKLDKAKFFSALFDSNYFINDFNLKAIELKKINSLATLHLAKNESGFFATMEINTTKDKNFHSSMQLQKYDMLFSYIHEEEHIFQYKNAYKHINFNSTSKDYEIISISLGLMGEYNGASNFDYETKPEEVMAEYMCNLEIDKLINKGILKENISTKLIRAINLSSMLARNFELELNHLFKPIEKIYLEQEEKYIENAKPYLKKYYKNIDCDDCENIIKAQTFYKNFAKIKEYYQNKLYELNKELSCYLTKQNFETIKKKLSKNENNSRMLLSLNNWYNNLPIGSRGNLNVLLEVSPYISKQRKKETSKEKLEK